MIAIGDEVFRTKSAALARASDLLNAVPLGEPLRDDAERFVAALFRLHPRAVEKAGVGVHHFEVRPEPAWSTRNFWAVRIDGSSDNFSIRKCVDGFQTLLTSRDDGGPCAAAEGPAGDTPLALDGPTEGTYAYRVGDRPVLGRHETPSGPARGTFETQDGSLAARKVNGVHPGAIRVPDAVSGGTFAHPSRTPASVRESNTREYPGSRHMATEGPAEGFDEQEFALPLIASPLSGEDVFDGCDGAGTASCASRPPQEPSLTRAQRGVRVLGYPSRPNALPYQRVSS